MKQNIYDDNDFFNGYLALRDGFAPFNQFIEQPTLHALLPPLKNSRVAELGCGFGTFARFAADAGASEVLAVDLSAKMFEVARQRNARPCIRFIQGALEDVELGEETFDIAVSSLAIHYIADYVTLMKKVSRCLKPGGAFVFSVEHPMATARKAGQGWIRDRDGAALHWPVDDYGEEGLRSFAWFVEDVRKYHRSVSTYVNGAIEAGLDIVGLREPFATVEGLKADPGLERAFRCPPFLFLSARKAAIF